MRNKILALIVIFISFFAVTVESKAVTPPSKQSNTHNTNNKIFKALIENANLGDAKSQFLVGESYDVGDITSKNKMLAAKWYELSALQGYSDAQYNLGVMYQDGDGVPQSNEKAIYWYTLAAEQNDIDAFYALGYFYGEQNNIKAYAYLSLAANAGHQDAQDYLETIAELLSPNEIIKAKNLTKKYRQEIK